MEMERMDWNLGLGPLGKLTPCLAVNLTLGACSGPPVAKTGQVLGYGTPGVSNYVKDDQDISLQAQLERYDQVQHAGAASQTEGLPAACGQLQRTVRNQPGNTVQPARTR